MTDIRTDAKNIEDACLYAQAIADTMREALVILDGELRVVSANGAFYRMFRLSETDTTGSRLEDLCSGQWRIAPLRQALEAVAGRGEELAEFEIEMNFPEIGRRKVVLNGRRVELEGGRKKRLFLTIREVVEKGIARRENAENQLREDENRFRTMLEHSQDVAYLRDLQLDSYEYISPVVKQITGFSMDELDIETVISRIHPDDLDRVRRMFEAINNHRITSGFLEYRFRRKDGKYLWLGDKYKLMQDENGQPRYRTGIVRDMTDRRQLEEDLRASMDAAGAAMRHAEEQRRILETILVGIPEGITVVKIPEGHLQLVSTYYEQYFRIPAQRLYDMSMEDRLKLLETMGWKGEKPVPMEAHPIFRALHRGEVVMDEEWRIIKPDGTRAVLSVIAAPVRDTNGKITHAVTSFRDITENKKMETALRRSEYELRTLVESSPDLIMRVDNQLRYNFVNRAFEQLTGKTKEQCIGRSHCELGMPQDLCRQLDGMIRRVLHTGGEQNVEFGFMSLFGNRQFWARLIPEFNRVGMVDTVLVVARDITERKRAEDHIRYVSFHDTVTGLYNRTYFEEEVQRLDTGRSLPVSFIMGDVNNLKLVNDTFGHNEGDNFLRKIAEALREACRDEDIVARWGGDEFAVILPETDAATGEKICARIRTVAKQTEGTVIAPSIALGVAAKCRPEENVYHVIRIAEERMYDDKLAESRRNQERVLSSLMALLGKKFPDLRDHIERERALAKRFGRTLELSDSQMAAMDQLVGLHEIGKAVIPAEVFKKPGRLTRKEWETVKRHPEAAYRIIKTFAETAKISDEVLALRERWDGSGYPRGLKGKDIPFLARAFAIMDVYDAITHERPYNRTLTPEEALEELRRNAGRQFDPELSEAFIRTMAG